MEMMAHEDETLDGKVINQYKQSDRVELKLLDLLRMGYNLIG